METAWKNSASRRSRVQKPAPKKKRKITGTKSANKHRFVSFSERISKINVDPIRKKISGNQVRDEDEKSHFISALERWKDQNLSESFTAFAQKVNPLCESLAQIVHFQEDIVNVLVEYTEKADPLCLEPLLDLITHLAHDLGLRFERYFEKIVLVVSKLATQHQAVEVIEWSFTCLAWLFKYLSRLLVPDLRPLYNLMAPLLGTQRHASFISRFAAESMSFLVRKAASKYHNSPESLDIIIAHAFDNLAHADAALKMQYQQSLAVLFSESMKGVQKGTHSVAPAVIHAMMSQLSILGTAETESYRDVNIVVEGSVIDVIHHTNADGFAPILQSILAFSQLSPINVLRLKITVRLLYVIVTTRKGSRISLWPEIAQRIIDFFDTIHSNNEYSDSSLFTATLNLAGVTLQYAPFDVALPFSQKVLRSIDAEKSNSDFITFCYFIAELGKERFNAFLLPTFQKFIANNWRVYETQLCRIIPLMHENKCLEKSSIKMPHAWSDHVIESLNNLYKLTDLTKIDELLPLCHSYVRVLNSTTTESEISRKIAETFLSNSRKLLNENQESMTRTLNAFSFCYGLPFSLSLLGFDILSAEEISIILKNTKVFGQCPSFLQLLRDTILWSTLKLDRSSIELASVFEKMIENLTSSSHDLRQQSLSVIAVFYGSNLEQRPNILTLAQDLEDTPSTVETLRSSSLKVRKLGTMYEDVISDDWMKQAIPAYCFGLLHIQLTPLWSEVCDTLRKIAYTQDAESFVLDRAINWLKMDLQQHSQQQDPSEQESFDEMAARSGLPDFQCSNLTEVDNLSHRVYQETQIAGDTLRKMHSDLLKPIPLHSGDNRAQGLRFLSAAPQLAEKRSRALVPVLLDWAVSSDLSPRGTDESETDSETLGSHDSALQMGQDRWSRRDQKTLLEIFGEFVNPSVLFRSKDVYKSLLDLLCNGDVEIQKSTLKALLTWKSPALTTYRENLFNILDDARFREELTTFLNNEEESVIRMEHRDQLMPILLRLLYGRATTRTGLSNARGSQEARRKAVLTSIARFGQEAVELFAYIALGPLRTLEQLFSETGDIRNEILHNLQMSPRRQLGMLRMIRGMLETLSDQILPLSPTIAYAVVTCLAAAQASRQSTGKKASQNDESSLTKSVRQEALACLTILFSKFPEEEWMVKVMTPLFSRIINPRLGTLAVDTAQAPSNLLKLFAAWASSPSAARFLMNPNSELLPKITDCLVEPSAKLEVRRYVLSNIIGPYIDSFVDIDGRLQSTLSENIQERIVHRISETLHHTNDRECIQLCVGILISLEPFVAGADGAKAIITAGLKFLSEPSRVVSPRLKGEILKLLQHFTPILNFEEDPRLFESLITSVAKLFSYFQDAQNRNHLVSLFAVLAEKSQALQESANVCAQLNAFSGTRLDEPNYDERDKAFQILNDNLWSRFSAQQWYPVLHTLLYLVRDKDELSTRSNASIGIRRFIQAAAEEAALNAVPTTPVFSFSTILEETLIPAIQSGLQAEMDLVRNEYISILGEMVKHDVGSVNDLKCLMSKDEESSFFNNITHIQPHRRNRALQRLSTESVNLSSQTIGRFCIPLVETLINDENSEEHNLANEAVKTLEHLTQGLEWKKFRALVQRMIQKPERFKSKLQIRQLGALFTALHYAHAQMQDNGGVLDTNQQNGQLTGAPPVTLADTIPDDQGLQKSLSGSVLSKLLDQIHYQDEASLDIRILVAVYAVKLILTFPAGDVPNQLRPVLADICNILKSRSQEARDSTRKSLAEIASIIGPYYFGFIVKQLRSSLKKGSQLHVLAYSVHSLLVSVSSSFKIGSLDYCLPDVVAVIIDDALGITAQEKETPGYTSSMKEVKKKALGFDSMEIVATMITLPNVAVLLKPISNHLTGLKPKTEKADELLRRIREGLRRNGSVKSRDTLVLCYEILKEATPVHESSDMDLRSRKMTGFALELLRRILDKHEELKTAENLGGFLPMFDKMARSSDEDAQMSLFRLLASIIKVPLKELDEYAGSFIRRAKSIIENSASTNEPLSQACLRLVSAVLRERPTAAIKRATFEVDVAFLVKKITPDLREPARAGQRDRQIAAFNFLKALMARGVLIKELFDTMDTVREVMITSVEPPIPDLARAIYSRFILDYFPEGGKATTKQMDFLVSNLQYEHARGRKSVMEVIAFILSKMEHTALQPVLVRFFIPLSLVLIVDHSDDCRDSAKLLLRKIFERADDERTKLFKSQMMKWQQADTDMTWREVVPQLWILLLGSRAIPLKDARSIFARNSEILASANVDEVDVDLIPGCLELCRCFCDIFPGLAFASDTSEIWETMPSFLLSDKSLIRTSTAHLISAYLGHFARAASESSKLLQIPFVGPHGLKLKPSDALSITKSSLSFLSFDSNDPDATERIIQNLTFIACKSGIEGTESAKQPIFEPMFQRISSVLRNEPNSLKAPRGKLSVLNLIMALNSALSADCMRSWLQELLLPLHNLTDESISAPKSTNPEVAEVYGQLTMLAREVIDKLQEKVGTSFFSAEMAKVQKTIRERRQERRAKRAVEAVAEPEKTEKMKRRKREKSKENRRERNKHAAGIRRGW